MNTKDAIYNLIKLTENYVFIDTSSTSTTPFYLYNPAGMHWREHLNLKNRSSDFKQALGQLELFNKKHDFTEDIYDYKAINFILWFWEDLFNMCIYLSTDNISYQAVSSPITDIKILTKAGSKPYISHRNDHSKIIISKG